jgi:hypothetical protein
MTNYTAPELLLVGAAQQLILLTCSIDKAGFSSKAQVEANIEWVSCEEDGVGTPPQFEDHNPF